MRARGDAEVAISPRPRELAADFNLPAHVERRRDARDRLAQQRHHTHGGQQRDGALRSLWVVEVRGGDLAAQAIGCAGALSQHAALAVPSLLVDGRPLCVRVVEGEVVNLLLALIDVDAVVPAILQQVVQRRRASLLRADHEEGRHATREPRVPPLQQRPGIGARRHLAEPRVAQADGLEYLIVGEGKRLEERSAAPVDARLGPRAVVRVAAAHLAAGEVQQEGRRIVAPHRRLERAPATHEAARELRPVAVHREVALQPRLGAPELGLRVKQVHQAALVVVPERVAQRRRGERRPRAQQRAAPVGDAEQHRAGVDALRVALLVRHAVVAPKDEVNAGGLVPLKRHREVHVDEDGVVVHPEQPARAADRGAALLGEHRQECHLVPLATQVPRTQQLGRRPRAIAVARGVLPLVLERELNHVVAVQRRARRRLCGGDDQQLQRRHCRSLVLQCIAWPAAGATLRRVLGRRRVVPRDLRDVKHDSEAGQCEHPPRLQPHARP